MCFNEKTSLATFAIGTIFNIIGIAHHKDKNFTAMAIAWEWVLLMQIFDAIAWRNKTCGSSLNKFATKGAYVANLMQPIIVFLAFISITDVSQAFKIVSIIIICIYISWILASSTRVDDSYCLTTKQNCSHLDYYWWENLGKNSTFIYLIVLLSLTIIIRPIKFAIFTGLYIIITLLISSFIYPCGAGSIWCWFAAFAPIFNLFLFKYLK